MENEVQKTILVTGFGPFGIHEINPSWEAVKLLPKLLETWEKFSSVNLVIRQIPVSYKHVSYVVKELWEKYKPSIMLHVGVSIQEEGLAIESQANSKGYNRPDIFNKCPNEDNIEDVILKTKCNIQRLCEVVNKTLKEENYKIYISDDAGRYLCEYIYYQSLAIGEPQVLFIHIPVAQKYSIAKSAQGLRTILISLIEYTMSNE